MKGEKEERVVAIEVGLFYRKGRFLRYCVIFCLVVLCKVRISFGLEVALRAVEPLHVNVMSSCMMRPEVLFLL